MFFKGLRFGKRAEVKEGDDVNTERHEEEIEEEIERAADALVTPMADRKDKHTAETVDAPLPLGGDEEEKEVAEAADALLTPMRNGEDSTVAPESSTGEDMAKVKDIFAESTQTEEEPSGKTPEKDGEAAAVEPENEGKDESLDNLFGHEEEEEEMPIQGLIASLPDITVQEVLSAAEEVKALMYEWQSSKPEKVPGDVGTEK